MQRNLILIAILVASSALGQSPVNPAGGTAVVGSGSAAGNYITSLNSDGSAAGPGAAAFTLANVSTTPGSFGSSVLTPGTAPVTAFFTANAKGLNTANGNLTLGVAASYGVGTSGASLCLLSSACVFSAPVAFNASLSAAGTQHFTSDASAYPSAVTDFGVVSTNTGATAGITAGLVCNIIKQATGTSPNYTAQATCYGAGTETFYMSTAAHAIGSEAYGQASGSYGLNNVNAASIVGVNLKSGETNVTFSATPTYSNAAQTNILTLTAPVTGGTFAAGSPGQAMNLVICENATGGFAWTPTANMRGWGTPSTVASKCSSQHGYYSSVLSAWVGVGTMVTSF